MKLNVKSGEDDKPLCKDCNMKEMMMELTVPDTPQMNGVMERRISVLIQCGNSQMFVSTFSEKGWQKMWAEFMMTENLLENTTSMLVISQTSFHVMLLKERSEPIP